MAVNYVDNKKLFNVLVKYRKLRAKRKTPPPIPDYVGECVLKIATRLANKPNFSGYSFREDMIGDAVENCLLYLYNFDPKKSQNPFAYFTQIIHYAFIRRIEREKKDVYKKYKYALQQMHNRQDHSTPEGESFDIKDPAWASYDNVHDFIRTFEEKHFRPRQKVDGYDEDSFDQMLIDDDGDSARPSRPDRVIGSDALGVIDDDTDDESLDDNEDDE